MNSTATAIAILFLQWVNVPLPNTPRTPDGNPNLTAPVPKTPDGKPDLTGIWRNPDGKYLNNIAADGVQVPFQPWAEALYRERQENFSKDRPSGRCLPHGVPDIMLVPATPFKIIQTPVVTLMLLENQGHFRQIFSRGFPKETNPTWPGYSIGKWEGDTFVVDSVGFNDLTYLDDGGHPHSDAYHSIERFRRSDFGHLDYEITIDDPKAYTRSWKVSIPFALFPDNELMESVCENERDFEHLVGK
ncbi:MAG: hypothetical protein DMG11_11025 [Acidobacteria bacterium]|nr:MAG: hypothetical protein DMG11_11025 [Acidobacteriota bacterium]